MGQYYLSGRFNAYSGYRYQPQFGAQFVSGPPRSPVPNPVTGVLNPNEASERIRGWDGKKDTDVQAIRLSNGQTAYAQVDSRTGEPRKYMVPEQSGTGLMREVGPGGYQKFLNGENLNTSSATLRVIGESIGVALGRNNPHRVLGALSQEAREDRTRYRPVSEISRTTVHLRNSPDEDRAFDEAQRRQATAQRAEASLQPPPEREPPPSVASEQDIVAAQAAVMSSRAMIGLINSTQADINDSFKKHPDKVKSMLDNIRSDPKQMAALKAGGFELNQQGFNEVCNFTKDLLGSSADTQRAVNEHPERIRNMVDQWRTDMRKAGQDPADHNYHGSAVIVYNNPNKVADDPNLKAPPVKADPPAAPSSTQRADPVNPSGPKDNHLDPLTVKTGTEVTTKLLNQLSGADFKPMTIGQGAEATNVFMREGKVIGGFDRNKDGQTTTFVSRDDVEKRLKESGNSIESVEASAAAAKGALANRQAAEQKASPAPAGFQVDRGADVGSPIVTNPMKMI